MNLLKEEIITTDGYLNFCLENNICYIKTDYFYTGSMNWRGKHHPSYISNKIVIGHSDYEITDNIASSFDEIYCINKNTNNSNVHSLPLGITNDCDDSPRHRIYGNKDIMINISEENIEKKYLLYLNFNTETFHERPLLFNHFKNLNISKIGTIEDTLKGREQFLREIKMSKFVLCPRGNGIDTHRLWETLYMGSIPIVKDEKLYDDFKDLPILIVNDWLEVTEEFLNIKYEEFKSKEFNMDKLKLSYWTDKILTLK